MRILTGYLPATSGRASVCGFDVASEPIQAKLRIGYLPEGAPLYGDMTPEAFLGFIASVRGFTGRERKQRIGTAIERMELTEVLHRRIETLSKGFRRRVGIAQAILHDPDVLVLDEPTDGLDPNQKHKVRNLIREMGDDKAILISTHLLDEVDAVCHRTVIISRGKLVGGGTPDALHALARKHNAVSMRLRSTDIAAVSPVISALPYVESLEQGFARDGDIWLLALPKGGEFIADRIGIAIRDAALPVLEFRPEIGNLEDVFRGLTADSAQ
jgi:ABC-2 type transport system ATP-binding protein